MGVVLEQAVHQRAGDAAGDGAFGLVERLLAARQHAAERARALDLDAAAVDLVAARLHAAGGAERGHAVADAHTHRARDLAALKARDHGQKAEAGDVGLARLDAVGIEDALAQHLVAAADAEDGAAGGRARRDGAGEAAFAQPAQVGGGAFRAGDDDEVGALELARRRHEARAHLRHALQRLELVEVGQARQLDHGDLPRAVLA